MAGLVPAIHVFARDREGVDARVKPAYRGDREHPSAAARSTTSDPAVLRRRHFLESVTLTGVSYLLSEPVAESMAQPMPPPRMMLPKVAPAAPDLLW